MKGAAGESAAGQAIFGGKHMTHDHSSGRNGNDANWPTLDDLDFLNLDDPAAARGMHPGYSLEYKPKVPPQYEASRGNSAVWNDWRAHAVLVEFLTSDPWLDGRNALLADLQLTLSNAAATEIEDIKTKMQDLSAGRETDVPRIIAETTEYFGLFENRMMFNSGSHPHVTLLARCATLIGWSVAMHFKERFGRIRPSMADSGVKPIIRVPAHPSFPSAHSTQANLMACALKDTLPTDASYDPMRADIEDIAEGVAERREAAGVHYESDTTAGELLAARCWTMFLGHAPFQPLIDGARKDWSDNMVMSGRTFLPR